MKYFIRIAILMIAFTTIAFAIEAKKPMTSYFDCVDGNKELFSFTFIDTDVNGAWDNVLWFDCDGKSYYSDVSESSQLEIPQHRIGYGELTSGNLEIGKDFTGYIFLDEEKTDLWAMMIYVANTNTFSVIKPTLDDESELLADYIFNESKNKFEVFPNPAQNEITVTLDCKNDQNYNVKIHSLNWVEVSDNYYIVGKAGSKTETVIPIDDLSPGIYHVRIESENGDRTFFKKVIVE